MFLVLGAGLCSGSSEAQGGRRLFQAAPLRELSSTASFRQLPLEGLAAVAARARPLAAVGAPMLLEDRAVAEHLPAL